MPTPGPPCSGLTCEGSAARLNAQSTKAEETSFHGLSLEWRV